MTSRSKVTWVKLKGHMGQGQIRVSNKGRWAQDIVKLLHLVFSEDTVASSPTTVASDRSQVTFPDEPRNAHTVTTGPINSGRSQDSEQLDDQSGPLLESDVTPHISKDSTRLTQRRLVMSTQQHKKGR